MMNHKLIGIFALGIDLSYRLLSRMYFKFYYNTRLGYCGKNVFVGKAGEYTRLKRMFLYDNTNISSGWRFLSWTGCFTMKSNSGAAQGLTIITGSHGRIVGVPFKEGADKRMYDIEQDIIVEEDVWIGANVTLCAGVTIGRGATIGAGAVIRKSVPPYAIVTGNPAKIVGFNFCPEEIVEHEKILYKEADRYSIDALEKNYEKHFLKRLSVIREILKL